MKRTYVEKTVINGVTNDNETENELGRAREKRRKMAVEERIGIHENSYYKDMKISKTLKHIHQKVQDTKNR